jgi:hypothetical protein
MPSTATIILTGVVYLSHVPQTPSIKAAVTHSQHDRISTRAGAIPRHRAFISVPKDSIDASVSGQRIPDIELTKPGKPATLIYFLRNETITFSGFNNTTLELPTPTGADEVKFENVMKLTNVCPTCRPLQANDFDNPDLKHVGGRIDIKVGKVIARALSPCKQGWHFDAEFGYPGFVAKTVPREVAVSLTVPNKLQLNTTALPGVKPGDAPDSKIVFKSSDVEVTIGSATVEDIVLVGGHSADRVDHHFELFYYLLERSNAAKHPLPVADPACTIIHRPSGIDCPPVQQ